MAKQAALDTSWMNLDAEAFLYPFHQVRQSNGGFLLAQLANECENLLGELVRLFGAALVRIRLHRLSIFSFSSLNLSR